MTLLSCRRFRSNKVRLWLGVIAYSLGNLWRRQMPASADGKKFSNGGRDKNRQPWTVGSSTIWARRPIQLGVNWALNCSLETD
jgi:hypothetical protein